MQRLPEVKFSSDGPDLSRTYWNRERETMSADATRALQTTKLAAQLRYLQQRSALYQEKFRTAGFKAEGFRAIEDLRDFPFTTKQELRDGQEQAPPFGTHQAAAAEEILRVTSTAGTTGKAVFQAYTRNDIMRRNESVSRVLWSFGVRPGDRVVNAFALSMFNAGVPVCTAVEHLGATDIPVGAERRAEGVLKVMQEMQATVWIGTPSFAGYLAEKAQEVLGVPASALGLRVLCGGGESGFELPSFRQQMEQAWGTPHVYDWASTSDAHPNVFAHCFQRTGKHQMTPDLALIQLIDPATGRELEITDGVEGEYIFSHLDREACPLLRYRTGDILKVRTTPCECGRTGIRVDIIGRSDDMLIVRGVNLFPSALQAVVGAFSPRTTGKIQIVLPRRGPRVDPPLRLRVECAAGTGEAEQQDLRRTIEQRIRADLSVTASVELVAAGVLGRTETKTKLIVIEEA